MASDMRVALLLVGCLSYAIGLILNGVAIPIWLEREMSMGGQQPGISGASFHYRFLPPHSRFQTPEEGALLRASGDEALPLLPEMEVVWVHCHEDWHESPLLSAAPRIFKKMTIIEKCNNQSTVSGSNVESRSMTNVGYEGAGYINYIIERYSNLPPWTVFVHGIPEAHNLDMLELFKNLDQTKLFNLSSHGWLDLGLYPIAQRRLFRLTVGRAMDSFSHQTPELGSIDRRIDFYCCMQHIVKDTTIRSRSHDFWKRFYALAHESHEEPGMTPGMTFQHEVGVLYEHSWHRVYGEPWEGMKFDHETVLGTLMKRGDLWEEKHPASEAGQTHSGGI